MHDDLRSKAFDEIMACIGCNDCLDECPLPSSNSVSIAELNHAIITDQFGPDLNEFLTQCTQCGQCVQVCPADLSRADMVLWSQLRLAEQIPPDTGLLEQHGEDSFTSNWTVDSLRRVLTTIPLFAGISAEGFTRASLSTTLRRLAPGELVVREGQYLDRLWIVLDGELEQVASLEKTGRSVKLLTLGVGAFHGYSVPFEDRQEPYTLVAGRETLLAGFSKWLLLQLFRESPEFESRLRDLWEPHAAQVLFARSELMRNLPEEARSRIYDVTDSVSVEPGEILYSEGDAPLYVYLVLEGYLGVRRSLGGQTIVAQYFHRGDFCGLSALLFQQQQSSTLFAKTKAQLLRWDASAFRALFETHPDWRDELEQDARKWEEANNWRDMSKSSTSSRFTRLEGLLDHGLIQGADILVVDNAICVGCGNCVDSCARRHGAPRLDLSGIESEDGAFLFPTACRHCEDPECLLCPVDAIVRDPEGQVRILEDRCIGCGACAERCPYDNINLVARNAKSDPLGRILQFLGVPEKPSGLPGLVATKCDLCSDYEDYACVTGCPVGAAARRAPRDFAGQHLLTLLDEG